MKLRKLMVLALVLALFVCVFAACGGGTDTDTQAPDTQAPDSETEKPGDDTEGECAHDIVVDEKAATCSESGYKKETCKLCGEVVSETAYPKTEHTSSGDATCDADSKCTVCGEVLEAAKGHVWGETVTTAATCTVAGKETKTCTVCNKEDVKELATLAHVIENVTSTVPATCVSEGSQTGVCSLCGTTQTVVLPAEHTIADLGDLSALTFVDGKIQAKCSTCEQALDVTGDVRLVLNFDQEDVPTELEAWAPGTFGYDLVYVADQAGTVAYAPGVVAYPDAADGHTSVLRVHHNSSPAVTFDGALLADADYYVISFDWRATGLGGSARMIGSFGMADESLAGAVADSQFSYAFTIDRSTGALYDTTGKQAFDLNAAPNQWFKVVVVVDNATGTAYTYLDGVCYSVVENANYLVVDGGVYTWRFGAVYQVYHLPEFDNFEVVAIQKTAAEGGSDAEDGNEEGTDDGDGTGCDHKCYLEYQLPSEGVAGFIKRTCLLCGRIVTYEILDHVHIPNVEADCVTDSYCTECGELVEAAWGHKWTPDGQPTITPAAPACSGPGTIVGKCSVCGDVESETEPAAHTYKIADLDLANMTFDADGNVVAECSVCHQAGVINVAEVFALTFDTDVNADLIVQSADTDPKIQKGRLYLEKNKCPLYYFDASLLESSDVYVISFDYRRVADNASATGIHGIFGLSTVNADKTLASAFNFALKIQRGTYKYAAGGTGNDIDANSPANNISSVVATKDDPMDKVVIVVDNANGYSYVYVNGVFLFQNATANMLVSSEKLGDGQTFAWRFGGQYNLNVGHEFDNFSVTVLDAECRHAVTKPVVIDDSTCIAPGSANTVCVKCGEIVGTEAVPVKPHVASDVVITEGACATIYECAGCGDLNPVTVAKENAVHTAPMPTSFDENAIVNNGKIQAVCSVCGLTVDATDVADEIRLQLDFDMSTVEDEIKSLATTENGLAYGDIYDSDQSHTNPPKVNGSVLEIEANKSAGISFNAALLKDADYYIVSFDWCINGSATSSKKGVVALANSELLGAHTEKEYDYALWVNRSNGLLYKGNQEAGLIADCKVTSEWQHIDIIVDNTTGNNYVYIDGEFFAANETGKWLVDGDGKYTLRIGGQFNTYKPHFDNLKVTALTKTSASE